MAVTFEGYERREAKTSEIMKKYGINGFEDALKICTDKGFNPYEITQGIQNGHTHHVSDTLQLFPGIQFRIRREDVPLLITGKGIDGFPLLLGKPCHLHTELLGRR